MDYRIKKYVRVEEKVMSSLQYQARFFSTTHQPHTAVRPEKNQEPGTGRRINGPDEIEQSMTNEEERVEQKVVTALEEVLKNW